MVESDVLNGVGVSLQGSFVLAALEVPHFDGGVLARGDHQTEYWVEYYLKCGHTS